jgi:hypothetical protein
VVSASKVPRKYSPQRRKEDLLETRQRFASLRENNSLAPLALEGERGPVMWCVPAWIFLH